MDIAKNNTLSVGALEVLNNIQNMSMDVGTETRIEKAIEDIDKVPVEQRATFFNELMPDTWDKFEFIKNYIEHIPKEQHEEFISEAAKNDALSTLVLCKDFKEYIPEKDYKEIVLEALEEETKNDPTTPLLLFSNYVDIIPGEQQRLDIITKETENYPDAALKLAPFYMGSIPDEQQHLDIIIKAAIARPDAALEFAKEYMGFIPDEQQRIDIITEAAEKDPDAALKFASHYMEFIPDKQQRIDIITEAAIARPEAALEFAKEYMEFIPDEQQRIDIIIKATENVSSYTLLEQAEVFIDFITDEQQRAELIGKIVEENSFHALDQLSNLIEYIPDGKFVETLTPAVEEWPTQALTNFLRYEDDIPREELKELLEMALEHDDSYESEHLKDQDILEDVWGMAGNSINFQYILEEGKIPLRTIDGSAEAYDKEKPSNANHSVDLKADDAYTSALDTIQKEAERRINEDPNLKSLLGKKTWSYEDRVSWEKGVSQVVSEEMEKIPGLSKYRAEVPVPGQEVMAERRTGALNEISSDIENGTNKTSFCCREQALTEGIILQRIDNENLPETAQKGDYKSQANYFYIPSEQSNISGTSSKMEFTEGHASIASSATGNIIEATAQGSSSHSYKEPMVRQYGVEYTFSDLLSGKPFITERPDGSKTCYNVGRIRVKPVESKVSEPELKKKQTNTENSTEQENIHVSYSISRQQVGPPIVNKSITVAPDTKTIELSSTDGIKTTLTNGYNQEASGNGFERTQIPLNDLASINASLEQQMPETVQTVDGYTASNAV